MDMATALTKPLPKATASVKTLPEAIDGKMCSQCGGSLHFGGDKLRCNDCGLPHQLDVQEHKPLVFQKVKLKNEEFLNSLPTRCEDEACGGMLISRGMTLQCSKCGADHTPGRKEIVPDTCLYPVGNGESCGGLLKKKAGTLLCVKCRRPHETTLKFLKEMSDVRSSETAKAIEEEGVEVVLAVGSTEEESRTEPAVKAKHRK